MIANKLVRGAALIVLTSAMSFAGELVEFPEKTKIEHYEKAGINYSYIADLCDISQLKGDIANALGQLPMTLRKYNVDAPDTGEFLKELKPTKGAPDPEDYKASDLMSAEEGQQYPVVIARPKNGNPVVLFLCFTFLGEKRGLDNAQPLLMEYVVAEKRMALMSAEAKKSPMCVEMLSKTAGYKKTNSGVVKIHGDVVTQSRNRRNDLVFPKEEKEKEPLGLSVIGGYYHGGDEKYLENDPAPIKTKMITVLKRNISRIDNAYKEGKVRDEWKERLVIQKASLAFDLAAIEGGFTAVPRLMKEEERKDPELYIKQLKKHFDFVEVSEQKDPVEFAKKDPVVSRTVELHNAIKSKQKDLSGFISGDYDLEVITRYAFIQGGWETRILESTPHRTLRPHFVIDLGKGYHAIYGSFKGLSKVNPFFILWKETPDGLRLTNDLDMSRVYMRVAELIPSIYQRPKLMQENPQAYAKGQLEGFWNCDKPTPLYIRYFLTPLK